MQADRYSFLVEEQTIPDGITLPQYRRARASQRRATPSVAARLRGWVLRRPRGGAAFADRDAATGAAA